MRSNRFVQRGVLALLVALTAALTMRVGAQERLQIVTSYSILADVVMNVAGDAADVTSIMPIGADPHTYAPTPSNITSLAEADVVFIVGLNFEETLMEAIEEASDDVNVVVVSSCIPVIAAGAGGHDHEEGEAHADEHSDEEAHEEGEEHGDEHSDEAGVEMAEAVDPLIAEMCAAHDAVMDALHEEAHDEGEEHADEEHAEGEDHDHAHGKAEVLGRLYELECGGHAHEGEGDHADEAEADHEEGDDHGHEAGGCDPHVWTDPHNVIYWTLAIRDALSALDPANAALYAANAEAYNVELDALAHDFIAPMVESIPEDARVLVTNHETLGYFAANYGFEIVGTVIPGGGTLAEPSAAEIAALIDLLRDEGVPAVFAENTVSSRLAEQVAAEGGAQFFTLYSDSLGEPGGEAGTYLDYMRANVTTITEALGGGM